MLKNKNLDFLIIQGFVPKGREDFWRSLIKIRSTELQISVIAVAGAENKKEIVTFVADPSFKIKEKLKFNREFLVVSVSKIKRIKKSPLLRGKTLFKKKLFGPFINDAKAGIYTRTINLNR